MNISTNYRGWLVLASGALALVVSGCGSGGSNAASRDAAGSAGDLVSVASVDGTDVLVDADGRTLYAADVENGGRIRCVDACVAFWKPVTASDPDLSTVARALRDELDIVKRPDGASQLAHDGLPLYTFSEEDAGELQGDGFTDDFQGTHFVWSAARTDESAMPPATSKSQAPEDPGYGYGY